MLYNASGHILKSLTINNVNGRDTKDLKESMLAPE